MNGCGMISKPILNTQKKKNRFWGLGYLLFSFVFDSQNFDTTFILLKLLG